MLSLIKTEYMYMHVHDTGTIENIKGNNIVPLESSTPNSRAMMSEHVFTGVRTW